MGTRYQSSLGSVDVCAHGGWTSTAGFLACFADDGVVAAFLPFDVVDVAHCCGVFDDRDVGLKW